MGYVYFHLFWPLVVFSGVETPMNPIISGSTPALTEITS